MRGEKRRRKEEKEEEGERKGDVRGLTGSCWGAGGGERK